MRAALIIGLLALALGGIFYFFVLRSQPEFYASEMMPQSTTQKIVPTTIPSLESKVPVGRTAGVWIQSLDAKSQRIVNEFRSEDVVPRPDGSVDVVRPQARFYGKNGGTITLEGSEGHVFYTQAGAREDSKSLGTSTPTSGDLKDVTIRFYEKSLDEEPTIVVTVPAVRFDSNSNRISTIDCVVNGQGFAAEQVPVTMRGRDFDFDGQGLTVAWNDREGMLDQLEILRGDRLLVRDVSKFIGDEVVSAPAKSRTPMTSVASALFGIIMAESPQARDEGKDLYHATFDRDVHVIKNGEEIASGDALKCVIPLGQSTQKSSAGDSSNKKPRAHADQTTRPLKETAATGPSTQPQPLEIRWTGKLLVRPVRVVEDAPRTQMVELVGSPARVAQGGTYAIGRMIHVEPETGRVRIEPGGNIRAIEIKDTSGAEIRSRSPLVIDQLQGFATIDGGGALNVPASEQQQSPLQMTWAKKLTLSMSKGEHSHLQSILVDGEAKVDSDRLKMDCATLELGFDAPAEAGKAISKFAMPSPDLSLLRQVHARGDAVCRVGAVDAQRMLSAQDIQLGFERGERDALLTSILCDGRVSLVDAKGLNLDAGNLSVQTQPISLAHSDTNLNGDFFALVTAFSAQKSVKIKRPDGSSVDGDDVELSGTGPTQRLLVNGSPATVSSAKGSLHGNMIELDPTTGDIRVPVAGRFAGSNTDRPGTDVAIAWSKSMKITGTTGVCEFEGGVNISGHDEKGSQLIADAKHGTMQFAVTETTTQPAANGLQGIQFESIRSLTLDGGVALSVQASDQRSSSMETDLLAIDLVNGTMEAPQAGRMLVIDQRKNENTGKSRFGPGALAMQWRNRLRWDMRGGNLTLLGGVRVGFEREGSNDPVRITCDRLDGTLTPLETQNGFDQMTPRIDLKMLRAEGNVVVRSKDASFDSADLVYDLESQIASAHGTDTKPVEVLSSNGSSRIGFSSIIWNLETGQIDSRDITGQIRR